MPLKPARGCIESEQPAHFQFGAIPLGSQKRLLEGVENALRVTPTMEEHNRWEWLCNSVNALTTTSYFDRYPKWQARAWMACAELHRLAANTVNELLCLDRALSINDKLPIKR